MSIAHQAVEVDGCFNGIAGLLRTGTLSKQNTLLKLSNLLGSDASYHDAYYKNEYGLYLAQKSSDTCGVNRELNLVFEVSRWRGCEDSWTLVFHFGTNKKGDIKVFRKTSITLNRSRSDATLSSSVFIGTVSEVLKHMKIGDTDVRIFYHCSS
ncbi:hypothetical protein CROQUDRAFT_154746 [Cronartium quercuum f. sp. fusiforme G11]|uniref:Uncharacterized protein n=1 Tax=Cronartium quercuum f. sp. fusiforme G11 TaxID=708437 RepID=A0A9P6NUR8_9BASI|nr:hypothetical protein CROQUDRAFT_154746 [Cronartium quercuum f. sp. fusiforme G11]